MKGIERTHRPNGYPAAALLFALRDIFLRFPVAELLKANGLSIGFLAMVPEQERQAVSRRTREALAVARARGVRLGNPNGAAALRRAGKGGVALLAAVRANADRHAADIAPVVADIRGAGYVSLRAIAAELNARGMLTRRGGKWSVSNVGNLMRSVGLRD